MFEKWLTRSSFLIAFLHTQSSSAATLFEKSKDLKTGGGMQESREQSQDSKNVELGDKEKLCGVGVVPVA